MISKRFPTPTFIEGSNLDKKSFNIKEYKPEIINLYPQSLVQLRIKRTKTTSFKFFKGENDHLRYDVKNVEANQQTLRLLSITLQPKKEICDHSLNYSW